MNSFAQIWQNLGRAARAGLVLGCLLIISLMLALAWWAYRPDYQVLFTELAPRDAAAMTAELDKMKTPYQLGEGGNTILVPRDLVYKTRLKLMGKDVPLHGAVGFEVFNNADFGMTDFVQKVNYLRAIQGELTRTILSIDGIASARVHLAIPEQGLFKKALTRPKASVIVSMKSGAVLSPEQISGIQRLVAASVPDIVSSDVTLLDQHGVALTRAASGGGSGAAGTAGAVAMADGDAALVQLDSRRSTEEYLTKKVMQVLERSFGPGEAVASVDVALNLDQSRVTTEEVLPAKSGPAEGSPTGVVVRERYTTRDTGEAALSKSGAASSSSEFDYQVGRRTEQLSSAGGTIKRMTVAVLLKPSLNDSQLAQLKEVIALAVGVNSQRGDAVVVYPLDRFATANPAALPAGAANPSATAGGTPAITATATANGAAQQGGPSPWLLWLMLGVLLCTLLGLLLYGLLRRPAPLAIVALDDAARAQLLEQVRAWTRDNGALPK